MFGADAIGSKNAASSESIGIHYHLRKIKKLTSYFLFVYQGDDNIFY